MKRSERIYQQLLRLYPRDFREEYGEEMSLLFRDRCSENHGRLWLQVLEDLVFHAPKEHWSLLEQDLHYAVRMLSVSGRGPGAIGQVTPERAGGRVP